MLTASRLAVLSVLAVFATSLAIGGNADARKFKGAGHNVGKVHVNKNVARRAVRNSSARNVARRAYRTGRWVNGVWVVGGVASSVAIGTASNCGYYWRKWKETGSSYWRERYRESCS